MDWTCTGNLVIYNKKGPIVIFFSVGVSASLFIYLLNNNNNDDKEKKIVYVKKYLTL